MDSLIESCDKRVNEILWSKSVQMYEKGDRISGFLSI